MDATDLSETVGDMRHEVIEDLVSKHIPERAYAEQWDADGLKAAIANFFDMDMPVHDWVKEEGIAEDDIRARLTEAADKAATEKAERFGPEIMTYVERSIVLQTLDNLWREHIVNLDHLRSVIGFRGYAQRDPLQEYKAEAFELFQSLLNNLRQAVTGQLSRVELVQQPAEPQPLPMQARHIDATTGEDEFAPLSLVNETVVAPENRDPQNPATWGRIGRNETCPCGSGKKYKHCHGAFESNEVV